MKTHEHCNGNSEIVKHDILTTKGTVWGHRSRRVDKWHTISEFRGEKSQNICIRISDIANSEMPMERKDS